MSELEQFASNWRQALDERKKSDKIAADEEARRIADSFWTNLKNTDITGCDVITINIACKRPDLNTEINQVIFQRLKGNPDWPLFKISLNPITQSNTWAFYVSLGAKP